MLIIDKIINGVPSITFNTNWKCSSLRLPRYSARYLLPALPKKFVMNMVIIRQKLKVILIEPRISLPNDLATKKLKVNGIIPTKPKAKPV